MNKTFCRTVCGLCVQCGFFSLCNTIRKILWKNRSNTRHTHTHTHTPEERFIEQHATIQQKQRRKNRTAQHFRTNQIIIERNPELIENLYALNGNGVEWRGDQIKPIKCNARMAFPQYIHRVRHKMRTFLPKWIELKEKDALNMQLNDEAINRRRKKNRWLETDKTKYHKNINEWMNTSMQRMNWGSTFLWWCNCDEA